MDINICFLLVDPQKSRQQGHSSSTEKDETSVTDDDIIADIIGRHDQFFNSMQLRLDKLQVLLRITFAIFLFLSRVVLDLTKCVRLFAK